MGWWKSRIQFLKFTKKYSQFIKLCYEILNYAQIYKHIPVPLHIYLNGVNAIMGHKEKTTDKANTLKSPVVFSFSSGSSMVY